jgi:hypothetical protein
MTPVTVHGGRTPARRPPCPAELDVDLRERTPRWGLWVDNTELTIDETVQHILDNKHDAIC